MTSTNFDLIDGRPSTLADRSKEAAELIDGVKQIILPFISDADQDNISLARGQGVATRLGCGTVLLKPQEAGDVYASLSLQAPANGEGRKGFLAAAKKILHNSVNTWSSGFLDKLYASTDAPGLAAELLLATLNTNAHVYTVSPALTCVEKHVTRALAAQFSLMGPYAGGVSMQGGAAANAASLLVARNVMFPVTKTDGVAALSEPLAVFTSTESHYSISKAAVSIGVGSNSVHAVSADDQGAMSADALSDAILAAIALGRRPFYVCATAGTTVRGAFDPLPAVADVCARHRLWLHVDACWGGPAVFSARHQHKLDGTARANSIAVNPHKMLGVPVTCSFLLAADLRTFSNAHKLDNAGYLFHHEAGANSSEASDEGVAAPGLLAAEPDPAQIFDLASLTPQCGRRADAAKFYLAWVYHGSAGFGTMVDRALAAAAYLAQRLHARADVQVLGEGDPPCAQVCFWYVGGGAEEDASGRRKSLRDVRWGNGEKGVVNSKVTRTMVAALVRKGWMVDFAPGGRGKEGEDLGEFLRVVMNRNCGKGIVDGLVKALGDVGAQVVEEHLQRLEAQGKV